MSEKPKTQSLARIDNESGISFWKQATYFVKKNGWSLNYSPHMASERKYFSTEKDILNLLEMH